MASRLQRFGLWAFVLVLLLLYLAPTGAALVHAGHILFKLSPSEIYDGLVERRLSSAVGRSALSAAIVAATVVPVLAWSLYGLRWRPRLVRRTIIAAVLLPLFIPESTHAFALSNAVAMWGGRKGIIAVAAAQLGFVLPFCAVILILQYSSLPTDLRDSSRDLGLSRLRYLASVLLPLILPGLTASFLFAFLLSLNEYGRTEFLQSREMYSTFLYGELRSGTNDFVYLVSAIFFIIGIGGIGIASLFRVRALGKQ